MNAKYLAVRAGFEFFWATQLARIIRRFSRSRGIILTIHRVLPQAPADFSPNSILQITPEFLEFVIIRLRELGIEIVSMDEAARRLELEVCKDRFAVLTFDDTYKDNLVHALPILSRRKCPFTLYVPTALVDGVGEVWWQALEDIIAQQEGVALPDADQGTVYLDTKTLTEKNAAYTQIYWRMRALPEDQRVDLMRDFANHYGFDLHAHCKELIMNWAELAEMAANVLCTIGGHTVHHFELAKLPLEQARHEIEEGLRVIEVQFGRKPKHLSYPIGGKRSAGQREYELAALLGLRTAVTTIPGGLYAHHAQSLTALPRISLNGQFQKNRYVDVYAAGAIFSAAAGIIS